MKYLLYEGENDSILFTREDKLASNPGLLDSFTNKNPTFSVETADDSEAVQKLNEFLSSRGPRS